MAKNLSNTQVDERLINVKRIDDYVNRRTPINFQCLICDFIWKISPCNLISKNSSSCPKCKNQIPPTNYEIDQKLLHRNLFRISDYVNKRTKILFGCKLCNNSWKTLPFRVLKEGCECPKCFGFHKYTDKEIEQKLSGRNIIKIGEYKQCLIPTEFKCLICYNIWKARFSDIINNSGCPTCSSNKNEKRCKLFFKKFNAEYEFLYNKIFYIKNNYRADIFLKEFNLFIEIQGAHHYKPVRYNSVSMEKAIAAYKKQVCRDIEIRNLCKNNNFNLIEIDIRKIDNQKLDAILYGISRNLYRLQIFINDQNNNIK